MKAQARIDVHNNVTYFVDKGVGADFGSPGFDAVLSCFFSQSRLFLGFLHFREAFRNRKMFCSD